MPLVIKDTGTAVGGEQVAPWRVGGTDGTHGVLRHLEGLGPAGGGQMVLGDQRFVPHSCVGGGGDQQGHEQGQQGRHGGSGGRAARDGRLGLLAVLCPPFTISRY